MMRSLYFQADKLDDDSRKRTTQSVFLHVAYGFTERFSASIMISSVRQERRVYSPAGGNNYTKAEGFGDAILFLQYTLVSRGNHTIFSSGGVKIPAGRTNITSQNNGLLLPADLQPGTGSWDGILGITYTYTGFPRPSTAASVNTIYRINSATERFNGEQIYKFGDEIQSTIGIGDQFLLGNLIVEPGFLIRYRHTLPDQIDKNIFPNTGGDWIFISPGLSLYITQNLSFNISGEIPIYTRLTGTQLSTDYRMVIGINYLFNTVMDLNL